MAKVTKDMTIEEVLKIKGANAVLEKHKFPCLHCPMASMEMSVLKIGEVCDMYGLDAKKLIAELAKLK